MVLCYVTYEIFKKMHSVNTIYIFNLECFL